MARRKTHKRDTEDRGALIEQARIELYRTAFSWKLTFLEYLKEVDRDPTLANVAPYAVQKALSDMGERLSVLGETNMAEAVLRMREVADLAGALSACDTVLKGSARAIPEKDRACESLEARWSLAEIRASLLARTVCDKEGKRLFRDNDGPELMRKSPVVLDRLYLVAAKLNGLPLPGTPGGGPGDKVFELDFDNLSETESGSRSLLEKMMAHNGEVEEKSPKTRKRLVDAANSLLREHGFPRNETAIGQKRGCIVFKNGWRIIAKPKK